MRIWQWFQRSSNKSLADMAIDQSIIQSVLDKTDLIDIIQKRVKMTKKGHNYLGLCPFHNEKSPSFNANAQKQFFHCFGCGASGDVISFIQQYDKLDFPDAVAYLAERVGVSINEDHKEAHQANKPLYDLHKQALSWYQKALVQHPKAKAYLKEQRGLSEKTIAYFQIGYAPDQWQYVIDQTKANPKELHRAGLIIQSEQKNKRPWDRFRNRIMFPIIDLRARIVGFGGRVLEPKDKPKYLNSPATDIYDKSREIYGLYQLKQAQKVLKRVIVVEGYMDVIALYEAGVEDAVACLGTAFTKEHYKRLATSCDHIIFCFDGDQAGREATLKSLETILPQMQGQTHIQFLTLPPKQDPDTYIKEHGKAAFEQEITNAPGFVQYLLKACQSTSELEGVQARAKWLLNLKQYVSQMPKGPLYECICAEAATLCQLPIERIYQQFEASGEDGGSSGQASKGEQTRAPAVQSQSAPQNQDTRVKTSKSMGAFFDQIIIAILADPSQACGMEVSPDFEPHPKLAFIKKLIDHIQTHPAATSAALMQHFSVEYPKLHHYHAKVMRALEASKEDIEFLLAQALKEQYQSKLDALIGQAKTQNLSLDQKQELQALLKAVKLSSTKT